jgi:tetratricopeptide (TPR) repeat protein
VNYFFSEEELAVNASLDAWDLLVKMGFPESALYREGNTIRLFCPLHKDQIRRSMIIYTDRNTFKCQYTNCEGHKGGNLLDFYAMYMGVELPEVINHIRNIGTNETDLVERADKMIQEGNLVEALPLLQTAVQLDPDNEITRCRLAALLLELGDKENGYREYMTAAEQFGVRGELDKTLNIYNILVIISPDDVKVRKQLSYLFSRLKREDEAVSQLKWVVDKHVRKGELKDAEAVCKKMIELCPEYPESHRTLGEVYLKQGNYFDAVEELRTATTHFIRQNALKKARDTVEQGLRYTPGNPAMKELRAKIEKAIELQEASDGHREAGEVDFENWLKDLKQSVGLSEHEEVAAAPAEGTAAGKNETPGVIPKPRNLTPKSPTGSMPRLGGGLGRPAGGLGRPAGGLGRPAGGTGRPAGGFSRPAAPSGSGVRQSALAAAAGGAHSAAPVYTPFPAGQLPSLAADDPRIGLCRQGLEKYDRQELETLQNHLTGVFKEAQKGSSEGFISEYETEVIREFYAAFCLALDAYKSESGKFKNPTTGF